MNNNEEDDRSLAELAKNALDCQNASNLSEIIHSFSRDISRLRVILTSEGNFSTDKLNKHPICVLYADKISSLSDGYNDVRVSDAHTWCRWCIDCSYKAKGDNLLGLNNTLIKNVSNVLNTLPKDLMLWCDKCKVHFIDGSNCKGKHFL